MKKYFYTPVLVVLLTAFSTVRAQDRQDYLGLPGDNLNLFAVMKLFQDSETLEGFERSLNDQENYINNLDLNGDGYVDYIRVIDNVDRNVHFIVLQVAVSPRENQDVAVFTVVQESNGHVTVQLVGDEALYGKNYIVEPIYAETPNPGYSGRKVNGQRVQVVHTTTYEVAAWPVVRFIFMPSYTVWRSPWYWDYYPVYWRPWNSYYWHHYYGYHYNYYSWYYGHYRHWNHHRHNYYHNTYYVHHHHYSPYVREKVNDGYYKRTYSRPESRNEGAAMYQRRSAGGGSATGVSNSGGRRSSGNSSARQSTSTSQSRDRSVSGNRTSGTREATGTRQTSNRQPSTEVTRQSRSSSNGKESTLGNGTRSTSSGTTRSTTTTTTTKRSTSTTSRESTPARESASGSSERRTSVGSTSRSSSSGQSVSKSSSQRSGSSTGNQSRRSSDSGSSEKSSSGSSEKSSRSTGRR